MCLNLAQTGLSFHTTKERIVRAENASVNGFETLGHYAGGVVAANVVGADAPTINILSLAYVASRIFYTFVYVVLREDLKRFASLLLYALSSDSWARRLPPPCSSRPRAPCPPDSLPGSSCDVCNCTVTSLSDEAGSPPPRLERTSIVQGTAHTVFEASPDVLLPELAERSDSPHLAINPCKLSF
ncbi:predicted protein [Verticillium alfalfae VaMs.102]|uniref:Predicted protein n=1 Tax=Verticillium alfalfae (strain VaMs.102 / ATCC MYA-4576 / FGSC 10136) TaxID=526221 RepID=C9SPP0_VERA1|nr:predicted protein [Verticillium alfalfae VaMs.102]EEY20755.1 predicted protein [Verticillium alfalfae VaMs.102]